MVGREIRTVRQSRGWNVHELAEQAGVSTTTITKVENARGEVQPGKLRQIRDALGLEPLAQVAARQGYPADVVFIQNIVGEWLMGAASPQDRDRRALRLTRLIAGRTEE
jgi:transcriptional regulator with XRE-family HTH domain